MDTKFIFVTGGVVSSLGKGIAASSIGLLLKSRGLKVFMPAPVEAKPAPQPSVPLKEVQGVVSNAEKPLSADEIKRIIKEELAEAKPEAKPASPAPVAPLTKEDVAAIVSAELKEALKPAEKPVEAKPEEPKPEEVKPEVKPLPEAPKEEEPAVVVEPVAATSLSAEELRLLIAEELTAAKDHVKASPLARCPYP